MRTRSSSRLILCLLCVLCGSAFSLDRNAFTCTHYDLRVHIAPESRSFAASGKVKLRNDSPLPQKFVSLQISSSLAWNSIKASGKPVDYVAQTYTSDIDHTGAVSEAVVTLSREIPPQGAVELEVDYSGAIGRDATRLTRMGVPPAIATRNDWDQISESFTAVRGVGYVCWYPVAMDSASLSEGNRLFEELGDWKARHAGSSMRLALTTASTQTAIANGLLVGQKALSPANPEGSESRERDYEFVPMGLTPPTFVLGEYTALSRPAIAVSYLPRHELAAKDYALAAEKILPLTTEWFGAPRQKVQVIELAEADATPFDSGAMLFTPFRTADPKSLELLMAHQLAHATISSERPWISEGLAHLAQALVRERQDGRKAALAYLSNYRPALVEAEKQAAGAASSTSMMSTSATGQPLILATDEVFYRTKAMFVWWMLRDMVGDLPLQRALRAYRAERDREPSYVQRLLEAQSKRQLEWFFDDWVYRDRGLPDFRVDSAFPRAMLPENVTVTVTVENLGDAGAEVPVLARTSHGEALQRVEVRAKSKAVIHIQVPEMPSAVVVNDGSVPESDLSNNTFLLPKAAPKD